MIILYSRNALYFIVGKSFNSFNKKILGSSKLDLRNLKLQEINFQKQVDCDYF